jgi:integrase
MQGDLTEVQARKVVSDILEATNTGEHLRAPAIEKWQREWLATKEASKAASTAERYRKVVDDFISHLGDRAKRPLTALSARDVQAFIAKRLKGGVQSPTPHTTGKEGKRLKAVSATTAQLDCKILRTALNLARRQGIVSINVAEAVELPEKDSIERGVFSVEDVKLLLGAAKDEWRTMILVGYYTGARLSDCCRLEWANIDLAKGTLNYHQTKTGKDVLLPLHPELQAHLEGLASSDKPEEYVMPGMAAKGPGGRHGMSEGFKGIVRKAGLDLQTVQGGGERKISRRTFHALRHSFTSALANANVAPELRMKLTGHSSEAIHRGYTHHELATLRSAVEKLPSLNG